MIVTTKTQKSNMAQVKDTIALLREAAWNSLFVFTKSVLGYDLLEENPHRELCEYLEKAVLSSKNIEVVFMPTVLTPSVKELPNNNKILLMLPRREFQKYNSVNRFANMVVMAQS